MAPASSQGSRTSPSTSSTASNNVGLAIGVALTSLLVISIIASFIYMSKGGRQPELAILAGSKRKTNFRLPMSHNPNRHSWRGRSHPIYSPNRIWPDDLRIDSVDSIDKAAKDPLPLYEGKRFEDDAFAEYFNYETPPSHFDDLESARLSRPVPALLSLPGSIRRQDGVSIPNSLRSSLRISIIR